MTLLKWFAGFLLVSAVVWIAGCVRVSGGTWLVREAAVPEGWPTPTPIGEVAVKTYPVYRAAIVSDADLSRGDMDSMFMTLFNHIKRNDIAMTAPVDMTFEISASAAEPNVAQMAFLYRRPTQGEVGREGKVEVQDLDAQSFVSVGVRGDYTTERFADHLPQLESWLQTQQSTWIAAGPPRYLGYNGPFTPPFMRYGEVQIPIRAIDGSAIEDP